MTDKFRDIKEKIELKRYVESAKRVDKAKVLKMLRSYAFHNVLDMMHEDEVIVLQRLNKSMYDRVIPRYCVRMNENKREALFYGRIGSQIGSAASLVSFNNDVSKI